MSTDLADWALRFAQERIAEPLPRRWQHDTAVLARAREIQAVLPEEERDLFLAAVAVHDIGFAPEAIECGFQPLDGARYLVAHAVPPRIGALVANSVSARIEGELRGYAADYDEWPDEATPVRDALWYCCMTHGPDGTPIDLEDRIAGWPSAYPEPLVLEFIERAREPLREAIGRTEARLQAMQAA